MAFQFYVSDNHNVNNFTTAATNKKKKRRKGKHHRAAIKCHGRQRRTVTTDAWVPATLHGCSAHHTIGKETQSQNKLALELSLQ